jgi:hypothetical protein
MARCGALYIYSLNDIAAVNVGASPISVQIYAWLEDVELGCPTATQIAITSESEDLDERKTGPVEKFATNAMEVTRLAESIPLIEPYAKASSIVMDGVKGIASIFGWSRPPMMEEPRFVKNRPFTSAALTIGSSTTDRIVMDPKQELVVDPRVVGIEEDEMVINAISGRETYLTTFEWDPTADLLSNPIWRCKVPPSSTLRMRE